MYNYIIEFFIRKIYVNSQIRFGCTSMIMNCKRVEKEIPAFLNNELDISTLKDFLKHIEGCADCREELSIQFLVTEGMIALEAGDSYDLTSALEQRIAKSHHDINLNKKLFWIRNVAFGTTLVSFVLLSWSAYIYL